MNAFSGIVHALSTKRSLFLRETFTVTEGEKFLKNDVACIVILRISENLGKERFVTVFCNNLMGKAVFSHNARAIVGAFS
jgi:hypothetical protein